MPTKAELEEQLKDLEAKLTAMQAADKASGGDPNIALMARILQASEAAEERSRQQMEAAERRHQDQLEAAEQRLQSLFTTFTQTSTSSVPTPRSGDADGPSFKNLNLKPPPPMEPDFTLSKFESWRAVWDDYYRIAQLDKLNLERQTSIFRSFLSLDMRSTLEHVIGVPPQSTTNPVTVQPDLNRSPQRD